MLWDGEQFAVDEPGVRDINKVLMQRYSMIEKIKEAQVIGILVGTVVVDGYLQIIDKLKQVMERKEKKYYEVLVGKINEPKLKNLAHVIDLYVLISCRETSMVDPKEYFGMPVVMPHEILLALQPDTHPWSSRVLTDFPQLLREMPLG
jgi:diphthamide biosynthesis protein 2